MILSTKCVLFFSATRSYISESLKIFSIFTLICCIINMFAINYSNVMDLKDGLKVPQPNIDLYLSSIQHQSDIKEYNWSFKFGIISNTNIITFVHMVVNLLLFDILLFTAAVYILDSYHGV
eukprot:52286_1